MEKIQANNNKLPSNLPQLQNLIKRDAASYTEEFERQHSVYAATCVIFEQNPTIYNEQLHQMVMFLAQDKNLRKFLKEHIVTDIKNMNSKSKNMKLNKELQNFMCDMLTAKHAVAAKTSLTVMIELYNKRVWNDVRTVNIIASACFSKITKIMVAAMKFFIGKDHEAEVESDSDSENENVVMKSAMMTAKVNKKTKKNQRKLEKVKATARKNEKKNRIKANFDFSALHLIHDPQNMAEKMYKRLEKMNERFEVKMMTMNLISRLIGVHQLYLPNFYPLVQRFLFPHQREVTKVMVFAAQAAHAQVPPDDLEPVLHTLANNFVTDRCSSEAMAMGINSIRELCARNPYCMTDDLLQDLTQYKTHKDKGVMMAARSLISLFRGKNRELLAKKDRGAPTEIHAERKQEKFGENKALSYIPGAEILTFRAQADDDRIEVSDSDDDEWSDVQNSHDEAKGKIANEQDGDIEKVYTSKAALKEVMKLSAEERAARATDVVSSRFLTDADFARIAAAQAAKEIEKFSISNKRKSKKRKLEDEEKLESEEIVSLKSIEMIYKKRKHDKEARTGTVVAGREGREKFGYKKSHINPDASTSNKIKLKTKNFMMLKHKIAGKHKKSFREKQIKLKNALLKQKKNYK
ncbi:protein SDA1 homolog isoform X2 [Panulirus ornatus]|uniref:protein SDA1 homolog isoform X2 n=1 Tax=Panulirus ornatus TaxID=150431 RepID=UPI003A882267